MEFEYLLLVGLYITLVTVFAGIYIRMSKQIDYLTRSLVAMKDFRAAAFVREDKKPSKEELIDNRLPQDHEDFVTMITRGEMTSQDRENSILEPIDG